MRKSQTVQMGVFLLFLATSLAAQEKQALFIGNSYTYFWNLPHTVEAMCDAMDFPLEAKQSTIGGANLGQHWRSDRELTSLQKLRDSDWDFVVLQDFSMSAIETPDSLYRYAKLWIKEIQADGAKPLMYMTWAREWNPLMINKIRTGYEQVANEAGADIVPVGLVWQRARELRPDLPLYSPDGSHPSPLGTYLTACAFYSVMSGKTPVGVPGVLRTRGADGETILLNIVGGGEARFCQQVVEEVLTRYGIL
ncbi:MAG: hypothetical protein KTR24_04935 [Saprospiraceae bacterium]|nr:hypothetical protein [Saprospiraceae bacterium]